MFERNRHGQLVYIPTVERISRESGLTIVEVARALRHVGEVYRDAHGMILPTPANFGFPHLRAQDNPPARLKSDTAYHERNED